MLKNILMLERQTTVHPEGAIVDGPNDVFTDVTGDNDENSLQNIIRYCMPVALLPLWILSSPIFSHSTLLSSAAGDPT